VDPAAFTLTVSLSDPTMRRALAGAAQAFADAEADIGPSRTFDHVGSQRSTHGSRPPSGNLAAVGLCKRLIRDAEHMPVLVAEFERNLDPDERVKIREFKAQVREMRRRALAPGQSVESAYRNLADAIRGPSV
jgi:hypothetical protein